MKTMKNDFISSARSVSDLKAHLVLTTKYRKKVLTGDMISRLRDVITDLCEKWDCKVIEFNGEDNHIHLLFHQARPSPPFHPDVRLSAERGASQAEAKC